MNKRVLITGVNGYIGKHVTKKCLEHSEHPDKYYDSSITCNENTIMKKITIVNRKENR